MENTLFTEITNSEATSIVGGAAFGFGLAQGSARGLNNAGTDNRARSSAFSFPFDNQASSTAQSESAAE